MTIFRLPDGTILPHYFGTRKSGVSSGKSLSFDNLSLRLGEVRELIHPGDKRSKSKKVTEYSVVVQSRDGKDPALKVLYPNCVVANVFGGVADKVRYTYRASTLVSDKKTVGNGSKVLLLCVNGQTQHAYIIAGMNGDQTTKDNPDDGHNYFWEFNGIRQTVNKSGEYQLSFKGATKANGELIDDYAKQSSGTTLNFFKDGTCSLLAGGDGTSDQHGKAGMTRLVLNAPDRIASLVSAGEVSIQGHDTINVFTEDHDIIVTPGTGSIKLGSKDAAQALVLGTDFRAEQQQMHQKMTAALQAMSAAIMQLATAHTAMGVALTAAGTAMMAGPTGNMVAAPSVTVAATQATAMAASLQAMNQAVSQMASAVDGFEGKQNKFLSDKHFTQK